MRRAFTLTELLVAVAAVALLTLGVGQIFRSVSRLTGSGQALAEVDSLARTLESRLREDFEGFARLPADRKFLVIRMREEGDFNRNGTTTNDADEIGLYLTMADRDFDRQAGLGAYGVSANGDVRSRAVTRRMDEMVFLSQAGPGAPHRSSQIVQEPGLAASGATALTARVYWGHGVRPRLDPAPQPNGRTGQLTPSRQYVPDGALGQPAGTTYTVAMPSSSTGGIVVTGRNEYAAQWILARQPLLLFGGTAAGGLGTEPAPLGPDVEFAPFIRDLETQTRMGLDTTPSGANAFDPTGNYPNPRYIFQGRVDVCAQDADDVQRWLEGEAPDPLSPREAAFAGAFTTGFYTDQSQAPIMNRRLWKRLPPAPANPQLTIDANLRFLRSALAGTLARPQAEDVPPRIDRAPVATNALLPNGEAPEDGLMDLHASIASRCSNFEIAWSDGTRAAQEIDFDNNPDTPPDYRPGDLVWFDISPVITPTNPTDPPRSTYDSWLTDGAMQSFRDSLERMRPYGPGFPRPEVASGGHIPATGAPPPNTLMITQMAGAAAAEGVYHVALTGGGHPPAVGGNAPPNEAVCVWGYRLPTGDGGYGKAWPKPKFIRVRATLHDSQFRLPSGKTYEFVFSLDGPTAG